MEKREVNAKLLILSLAFVFALAFALVLATGTVSAISTTIIVNAKPDSNVTINVQTTDQSRDLRILNGLTDLSGRLSILTELENPAMFISVVVRDHDGRSLVKIKTFENVALSSSIVLDATDPATASTPAASNTTNTTTPAVNTTPAATPAVNTTPTTATTNNETNKKGITGAVSGALKSKTARIIYYIIGGILILGIVFLFITRMRKIGRSISASASVDSLKECKEELKTVKSMDEKEDSVNEKSLEEAERKLKEAQEEISKIKTREDKLKEARRRLDDARINWEKVQSDL